MRSSQPEHVDRCGISSIWNSPTSRSKWTDYFGERRFVRVLPLSAHCHLAVDGGTPGMVTGTSQWGSCPISESGSCSRRKLSTWL